MINSINTENLPIKDLTLAGIIIFLLSIIIANIYNPLWALLYIFGNIITLTFLSWLYQDSWSTNL